MSIYTNGNLPTRTAKTEEKYLAIFERLRRKFMRELKCADMSPDEIVAHLLLNKHSYCMSTWRVYKSAALFVLEKYFPQNQLAIDALLDESSSGLPTTSKRTSGQKCKGVKYQDWLIVQKIIGRRIHNCHKHSEGLLDVLSATLLTGLRPNEWSQTFITTYKKTERRVLRVKNSKATNGRANGIDREFFIDDLTAIEISMIEAAIAYCRAQNDDEAVRIQSALKNELDNVKSVVSTTSKNKFSKISLYSFRHQFIANAKMTFNEPVIVAALAGHNSTKTAYQHYGKRSQGYTKIRVYPTPETILAVKNISSQVNPQLPDFPTNDNDDPSL